MEQSGFIVGFDLGTSKIVGLLARRNEQGVVSVLASESIASESCVRYGVVYNIEDAAGKLKKLIHLLENKTGKKIGKAYFSVSGKSLTTISRTESMVLPEESEITIGMVDDLERKAKNYQPENLDANYGVLAPELFVDGVRVEDFAGQRGTVLEGRYQVVVGRPNLRNNLRAVAEKAGIAVAGFTLGNLTASALLLKPEDKQKGCALVDCGAGTTTLSIYTDGVLRFMKVIPLGGKTVTKDVRALLNCIEPAAEDYKIRYAKVGKDRNKNLTDERSEAGVDVKELNKVVQLRCEEIVLNIQEQIKLSGYAQQISEGGIVLTGGASQQTGLEGMIAEKLQLPVRMAVPNRILINNVAELVQNPAYADVLSIFFFASKNCEKVAPRTEPVEEPIARQEQTPARSVVPPPVEKTTEKPVAPVPEAKPVEEPQKPTSVEGEKPKRKNIFAGLKNLFSEEE